MLQACPIDNHRIDGNEARLYALFTTLAAALYLVTGWVAVPLIMALDMAWKVHAPFTSPLGYLSRCGIKALKLAPALQDRAPKRFAGRVGVGVLAHVVMFYFLGLHSLSLAAAALLGVLASLECSLGFCAGCAMYPYAMALKGAFRRSSPPTGGQQGAT